MLDTLPREILCPILGSLDIYTRATMEATCRSLRAVLITTAFHACIPACIVNDSFFEFLDWLKARGKQGLIKTALVEAFDFSTAAMVGAALGHSTRLRSLAVTGSHRHKTGWAVPMALLAAASDETGPPPIDTLFCSSGMGSPVFISRLAPTLKCIDIRLADALQANLFFSLTLPHLEFATIRGQCFVQCYDDHADALAGAFPALKDLLMENMHFTGRLAVFRTLRTLHSFEIVYCTGVECVGFPENLQASSVRVVSSAFPAFIDPKAVKTLCVAGMPPGMPALTFPSLQRIDAMNVDMSCVVPAKHVPALTMLTLGGGCRYLPSLTRHAKVVHIEDNETDGDDTNILDIQGGL